MPHQKISYNDIVLDQNVYSYCINQKFKCPYYGTNWSCPPAAPFLKEKLSKFKTFYLIYYKFDIQSYILKKKEEFPHYSEEKIRNSLIKENLVNLKTNSEIKRFIEEYDQNYDDYIIIWPETCKVCLNEGKKCTYVNNSPCRYPEKMRYHMSGAGINSNETASKVNIVLEWPPTNYEYRFGLVCLK